MSRLAPIVMLVAASLACGLAFAERPDESAGAEQVTSSSQTAAEGFEPVDPASLETVSGAQLMISAYAVIVGAILLYCLILFLREGAASRAIKRLEQQIDRTPK